jgi:asparagine synthase (glutamine-hydrolysing)
MCGILGSINLSLNNAQFLLQHRGPDAQTTFKNENLILWHFRLSIQDVSGGSQPMQYKHFTIIYNGEIYNHKELRHKYNLNCHTASDTETLLHLYDKLGIDCLQELDGMFAVAIYDAQKKQLFLARDRAGKKPMYIYNDGQKLVFASELNAIASVLPLVIETKHIQEYITLGFFFRSHTPYQHVAELESGSYSIIDMTTLKQNTQKWWSIKDFYQIQNADSYNTALGKIENYLLQSVRRRVEASDLEVGSFLSGGIDSGIVTAMASQFNKKLKTFTVSFQGEYDEAPLAKLVARRYNTQHHEIKISFDNLTNDLEKILTNYGEPFSDSSAIPSYYVSREAKKHLTVILNGDGGDELFGGYRRYVPFAKYDFFAANTMVQKLSGLVSSWMPISNDKKSKYNYAYRLLNFASHKNPFDTYLSATTDIFSGFEKELLFKNAANAPINQYLEDLLLDGHSGLQKIMLSDFEYILFGDLLVKMDIATMAHSLEGRSPLLSKELLEYVPSINDNYKVKGGQTKVILRKLAEQYLPSELINQPKRGFEIPLKKWVNHELKSMIFDYLNSENTYSNNFVSRTFINTLLHNPANIPEEKRVKMIWSLFALEVWYKNRPQYNSCPS